MRFSAAPSVLASILLASMLPSACAHTPTPEEMDRARGQYKIGLALVHEARSQGAQMQGIDADQNWRQALRELQKGEKLDPGNADIQYLLGMVYFVGFHREAETLQHLERAIAIKQGEYPEAQFLLGTALVDFGRPQDAIEHLEAARQNLLYATPYYAQQELGWALYKLERYDEAAAHLGSSLAAYPDLCNAYVRLADVEERREQWERVEEVLEQFVTHCDSDRLRDECGPQLLGYGYYRLGLAKLKLGDRGQAQVALETCSSRFQGQPVARECGKSLRLLQQ